LEARGNLVQENTMKIRIHTREQETGPWTTNIVESEHVPRAGEYLAPAPVRVFRVTLTLHVLFNADYDAEVFAEIVDFEDVQRKSLGNVVWSG
jgi:hypothetical protein